MTRILLLFFLFAFSQSKAHHNINIEKVKNADGPIPQVSVSVERLAPDLRSIAMGTSGYQLPLLNDILSRL